MFKKQIFALLMILGITNGVYCSTASNDNITISMVDYSKRQMASFFPDLPKNCFVTMLNLNAFTKLYPVRFIITNHSDKTYKLTPNSIGGSISLDYKKIVKQLPLEAEGNGGFIASIFGIIYGGAFTTCSAIAAVDHHDKQRYYNDTDLDFLSHLKKCAQIRWLTGCTTVFGTITMTSLLYAILTAKDINAKRYKWIQKNSLPKEGKYIRRGEEVEVIVFLTHETYNHENIIISLVESGAGNLESFNLSLTN